MKSLFCYEDIRLATYFTSFEKFTDRAEVGIRHPVQFYGAADDTTRLFRSIYMGRGFACSQKKKKKNTDKPRVSLGHSNIAAEWFPAALIFIRSTATSIVRGNAATPARVIAGLVIRDGHTRVSERTDDNNSISWIPAKTPPVPRTSGVQPPLALFLSNRNSKSSSNPEINTGFVWDNGAILQLYDWRVGEEGKMYMLRRLKLFQWDKLFFFLI